MSNMEGWPKTTQFEISENLKTVFWSCGSLRSIISDVGVAMVRVCAASQDPVYATDFTAKTKGTIGYNRSEPACPLFQPIRRHLCRP